MKRKATKEQSNTYIIEETRIEEMRSAPYKAAALPGEAGAFAEAATAAAPTHASKAAAAAREPGAQANAALTRRKTGKRRAADTDRETKGDGRDDVAAEHNDRAATVIVTGGRGTQGVPRYDEQAYVLSRIQALLAARYGYPFRMYCSEDGKEECWTLLEHDLQHGQGGVEVAARIYEHIEDRGFALQLEGREPAYRMFPTIRNNVCVYPAWEAALVRLPVIRPQGVYCEDFVFARSDEALQRFLLHMRMRREALDRRQVTVFTDGRHGLDTELSPMTRMVTRDEVIMEETLKRNIFHSIDTFFAEDQAFFERFGIPYKRGILLYGKPGNGKTTLVKSIAGSVHAPVAYWQITEHTCSDSVQEVFERAVKLAPMILVIEDIDSMPERARSYFLNTLDGATSKEGIFLIGTTNYPENIDPALMNRAGRFDRAYEIRLPDAALRLAYLRRKGMAAWLAASELETIARRTDGFTFAQLNELYVSAALQAHDEGAVNAEALIRGMKQDLHKSSSRQWLSEDGGARVGFLAM